MSVDSELNNELENASSEDVEIINKARDLRLTNEQLALAAFHRQKTADLFNRGLTLSFVFIIFGVVLILSVRLFHLVAHPDFLWLDNAKIELIDSMITYILFGSGGTQLYRVLSNRVGNYNLNGEKKEKNKSNPLDEQE